MKLHYFLRSVFLYRKRLFYCFSILTLLLPGSVIKGMAYASPHHYLQDRPDKIISGRVTDAEGKPLAGVSIGVKGTSKGTITNGDGQYQLAVDGEDAILVFSYVGYQTKEIKAGSTHTLNVSLEADIARMKEAVVVGYGVQDKRALTSSVATIQNDNLKDIKATSFEQLIIGQVPGVNVQQTTGQPGAGLNIRIRGTGSITALNDPLYVVDGFPIEPPGYDNRVNILSFINPADIESITILKDAASTSIYGSRGSNGVVLITTKSAQAGKTTLEVNAYYGMQQIPERSRIKMMNAEEFAQFRIEALEDAAKLNGGTLDPGDIPEGYRNVKGPGTDWFDVVTRNFSPVQSYNITLRSGTAKTRTLVSADYYSIDGIVRNTDYKRLSMRANIDVDISKKIRYGARINPSMNFRNLGGAGEGDPFGSLLGFAQSASPIEPVYLPDGSLNPQIASAPENFVYPNPENRFRGMVDKRNDFRLLASNFIEVDLLKGLTFKTNIGGDLNMSESRYFYPSYIGIGAGGPGSSVAIPPGHASASAARDQFTTWLIETYLTYRTAIAKNHNLELLLGHTAQKQEYSAISASGSLFPNDDIPYVSAAIPGDFRDGSAGSDNFRYSLESVFARANYNFKGRYYLQAAVRKDGTSRFSSVARWGTFPSVSAGWMISEEPFMKNPSLSFLNELKLRASYGVTGNNNIRSSFAYIPGLARSNYVLGNATVLGAYVNFADEGLKWESNRELDIGLDIAILDNRIRVTADYYRRVTYDLLLNRPIPSITGFGSALTNIGSVENKGVELGIVSQNISTGKFNWTTNLNISTNRNKVLALNDNKDPIEVGNDYGGASLTSIGQPMGLYKGWLVDGIYQTEAEAEADRKNNRDAHAGTLRIRDLDGDGIITSNDRGIIGNPWPDFTFGITNRLQYRDFDLNILIHGTVGNDILMSSYEFLRNIDGVFNVSEEVKNRWRSEEQPGDGIFPTTNYPDQRQYVRRVNSTWVYDATHAAVSNITLGYTLPQSLLKRSGFVKMARVYFTVQNALLISGVPVYNPDASASGDPLFMGFNTNSYPLSREMTLGINVSLQ